MIIAYTVQHINDHAAYYLKMICLVETLLSPELKTY